MTSVVHSNQWFLLCDNVTTSSALSLYMTVYLWRMNAWYIVLLHELIYDHWSEDRIRNCSKRVQRYILRHHQISPIYFCRCHYTSSLGSTWPPSVHFSTDTIHWMSLPEPDLTVVSVCHTLEWLHNFSSHFKISCNLGSDVTFW